MNLNNAIKEIANKLSGNSSVLAVYVLGSSARGEMRPDSDIDVGIIMVGGCQIDALERAEIANHLTGIVGYRVDLGVINSKNLVYARQAILTGSRIYVRDRFQADMAASTLLGMYARFNEDRMEVLDAYRAG